MADQVEGAPAPGSAAKKPEPRYRAWVFTTNNPRPDHRRRLKKLSAKYIVWGEEVAPCTKTPHLQGLVIWPNAKTLASCRKLVIGSHVEPAASGYLSMLYCKKGEQSKSEWNLEQDKGDNYGINYVGYEAGVAPQEPAAQGQREKDRYTRAFEDAKVGNLDSIPADIMIRHYSTIKRIKSDYQPQLESMPEITGRFLWYWGDTGTGKSRKAREDNPIHYLKQPTKWWDGFDDQPCVIIDEWDPTHEFLATKLKQWADHHAFAAEIKNGSAVLRPRKIVVTSNYSIQECFPKEQDYAPLLRRFQQVHFSADHPFNTFSQQMPRNGPALEPCPKFGMWKQGSAPTHL